MPLVLHDLSNTDGRAGFDTCLERLRATTELSGEAAATVATVIDDVRRNGDEAVVRYMQTWTDPKYAADRIRVSKDELKRSVDKIAPALRDTIAAAIDNVRKYQHHVMPATPDTFTSCGAELGMRFVPVKSCGLAVPGGKAAYPSTVIMLAIPAIVAGVAPDQISVVTPPPTRAKDDETSSGNVPDLVLAACHLCGLSKVYRIGGAQAMAALAFGTQTVDPVDLIVGPGNVFVQLAKAQLSGKVGIDGFYGPSEIVTIADSSAKPQRVAADLLAQAEHDPGKCFLVTWDKAVYENVKAAIVDQLKALNRADAVEQALRDESCAVLVRDEAEAVEVANTVAPEHLNLAVADPKKTFERIRNAGEVFLGDATPVAAGDYWAGPSHTLPTGTTARFNSGISVYTFLKRIGTVGYPNGMPKDVIDSIARLAEAEGLDAHANSVRVRGENT